jgi:hypothetical protein
MSNCVVGLRRLRASSRDGSGVVNRPPSPLNMLLSRHTRWREFTTLMRSCATDVGFVDSRSALPSAAPGRTLSFLTTHANHVSGGPTRPWR